MKKSWILAVSVVLISCAAKKAVAPASSEPSSRPKLTEAQLAASEVSFIDLKLMVDSTEVSPSDSGLIVRQKPKLKGLWRMNWPDRSLIGLAEERDLPKDVVAVVNYLLVGTGVIQSPRKFAVTAEVASRPREIGFDDLVYVLGIKDGKLAVRVLGDELLLSFDENSVYSFEKKLKLNGHELNVIANLYADGKGRLKAYSKPKAVNQKAN